MLVNPATGLFYDGLDPNCRTVTGSGQLAQWSYNSGVILTAWGDMAALTGDPSYLQQAADLIAAAAKYFGAGSTGQVLTEVQCGGGIDCDSDQDMFKGILVRKVRGAGLPVRAHSCARCHARARLCVALRPPPATPAPADGLRCRRRRQL